MADWTAQQEALLRKAIEDPDMQTVNRGKTCPSWNAIAASARKAGSEYAALKCVFLSLLEKNPTVCRLIGAT